MFDAGEQTGHAGEAAVPVSPAPSNIVTIGTHVVTLSPRVTMAIGMAAASAINRADTRDVLEGLLAEVYLRLAIADWSFTDAKGNLEPITPETIARLLPFEDGGLEVAERANALYSEAVFAPLVRRLKRLSPPGPTDDTTPPISRDGTTPPKPSKPSSPTITDGTPSEDPGL